VVRSKSNGYASSVLKRKVMTGKVDGFLMFGKTLLAPIIVDEASDGEMIWRMSSKMLQEYKDGLRSFTVPDMRIELGNADSRR
jgi:hypothetical protein